MPSATNSIGSVGAIAATRITAPKPNDAITIGRRPVLPRAAATSPPTTAPMPMAAVISPNVRASPPKTCLAATGRVTWKL